MNPIPNLLKGLQTEGKRVSILVNNPLPERVGEGYESYVGKIGDFNDEFVMLETPTNSRLEGIVLRYSMILSIWIYKD